MPNAADAYSDSLEMLESPFLHEEIVRRPVESSDGSSERFASLAGEDEVLGRDDRALVSDTIKVPNQWICAIDIMSDNPKWGSGTSEPRYLSNSRASGVLIGPRYVLTARHVFPTGDRAAHLAKVHTVSPGRNGSNRKGPFRTEKSVAVQLPQPYRIRRTVGQGSQATVVEITQHDDYALVILEKDVDSATHNRMKGTLGYWGRDQHLGTIRVLQASELHQKDVIVVGYPGDTCGKDRGSGTEAEKLRMMEECLRRRPDEWASRQWRSEGTADVRANSVVFYHTADTYQGQSGAPVGIYIDKLLHLAGIHVDKHDAQHNKAMPVTARMLNDLRTWINADAGYEAVAIANGTMTYRPRPATRGNRELP